MFFNENTDEIEKRVEEEDKHFYPYKH